MTGNPSSLPAGPPRWLFVPGITQVRQRWLAVGVSWGCLAVLFVGAWVGLTFPKPSASRDLYPAMTAIFLVNAVAFGWVGGFLLRASAVIVNDHVDMWTLGRLRRISAVGSGAVVALAVLATVLVIVVPLAAGGSALHPLLPLQLAAMVMAWALGSVPRGALQKVEAQVEQVVRGGRGPGPLI